MSTGSFDWGSGRSLKASRILAMALISAGSMSGPVFLAPSGLRTQRMTKRPIMHMMRSARVKIHSGHSSHSWSLHLHWALDIVSSQRSRRFGHCGLLAGGEEAHELHFDDAGVVVGLDAHDAL